MSNSYRTAYVYVNDVFAGTLQETEAGFSFEYDNEYMESENSAAVSLTLPLSQQVYTSKTMFAFFDGLIPEGWLLDIAVNNWKLNPKDRFGILLAACKDPVGNVSILEDKI